jgi:hypothetical protein
MPAIKRKCTDYLPITTLQHVPGGFVVLTYRAGLAYQQIFRCDLCYCAYTKPAIHQSSDSAELVWKLRVTGESVVALQQGGFLKRLMENCEGALSK